MRQSVMKMRYIPTCLLLIFILCFSGCTQKINTEDSTKAGTEGTGLENPGETASAPENSSGGKEEGSIMPTASPDAEPLENGIYATCGNYNIHIYPFTREGRNIDFYVIYEEELPEDMEVVIDTTAPYWSYVEKLDLATDFIHKISEQGFPYYLYQCYRGMNWVQLGQMEQAAQEAQEKYEKSKDAEEKKQLEDEWTHLSSKCTKIFGSYIEDYQTFLEEADPNTLEFCCYRVSVSFEFEEEERSEIEQITSLTLQSGEWSTAIEIGTVELCDDPTGIWKDMESYKRLDQAIASRRDGVAFWTYEGHGCVQEMLDFIAKQNITLKNFYFYEDPGTVLEKIRVNIETDGGKQSVLWKPGQDILIREGERFKIDVLFSDSEMSETGYCGNKHLFMEYEADGVTYSVFGEITINANIDPRAAYAQYFQGIDVESYYKNYDTPRREREIMEYWK